ncbi:MAG TPA: hypothetical protein VN796_10405 [Acidimicrobiales bacterium]|nr:hypothetical protein [Acidimicrobiales bacterium]
MVVRLSWEQTQRAQQLSGTMSQIATAIRLARSDRSSSPQVIKQLLDRYCETEAELRSLIPRPVKPIS